MIVLLTVQLVSLARLGAWAAVCLVLLSPAALKASDSTNASPAARFNRDIRPILSENCYACHGPDSSKRKAKLRLDIEENAKAEVIVPGKPEKSELIKRVFSEADDERMPPPDSRKVLTEAQKQLLKQWVAEGAPWEPHWAYMPLSRSTPPKIRNHSWPRNPIDQFILARLEQQHLAPAVEADKRTLIRRLSLDLTGLPPQPQDIDNFLLDNRPEAYEQLVDRLLASPHHGERMAVWWLDLVRYAESVGYHGDQTISVWPYRDYVIRAFNQNLPFDEFTREQLAGDLLPSPTRAQKVASGYNRLGMMSAEGGVQDKEYLAKYAAERVRNISGVWLGATLGCAECHDHKYDPYTSRDFYSMEAFFADLKEEGFYKDGYSKGNWGPSLRLPTPDQQKQLDGIETDLAAARKTAEAISDDSLASAREKWELQAIAYDSWGKLRWHNQKPMALRTLNGAVLQTKDDDSVQASGPNPDHETYVVTIPAPLERITALRLEVLKDDKSQGNELARSGDTFVLSEVEIQLRQGTNDCLPLKVKDVRADFEAQGFPALALIDGKPDTGWAQGKGPPDTRRAVFQFAEPIHGGSNVCLVVTLRHDTKYTRQTIGRFRLALSSLEWPPSEKDGVPEDVMKALKVAPEERKGEQRHLISNYYRKIAPELIGPNQYIAHLEMERSLVLGEIPTTLIAEATTPRPIRVLPRGNWMNDSGAIVQPAVPHFLHQIDNGTNRATRLDLANWLVARDNSLTARVLVNRLWKMFFGTGLSKTVDDFGAQGEQPVHPELLDWLAADLLDHHWDLKHTIRLMVTSAAYRESSVSTPEIDQHDPYNRLCAHQSRVRLDAEFIRDNALAASGLLVDKIGGPSVKPWQPPGFWAPLNFPHREYEPGRGADTYRRGLYTHWQRTFLCPALQIFDAPTREECTVYRTASNTPLQALVLLNDPEFVEAARVLAAKIASQPADFDHQLEYAFDHVLGRPPRKEETKILRGLFDEQHEIYQDDEAAARSLVSVGGAPVPKDLDVVEVAAWTSVSRALLNLHETITRN